MQDTVLNSLLPHFAQVPALAALPEEAQRRLERLAEQRQYRRRQVIHFPDQLGDFLYLLCSGRVKISRLSDQGREVTLHLLEGPTLFGETGLVADNARYDLMAETLDDSFVAVLRRSDMLAMLQTSPQASLEMLRLVSERRAHAESLVADLVFLEVSKRVAKLLLHLHDTGDKAGRGSLLTRVKFTHQELANLIGSTRETTTLILNDFKRQGFIEFVGRKMFVLNRASLESIVRRSIDAFGK